MVSAKKQMSMAISMAILNSQLSNSLDDGSHILSNINSKCIVNPPIDRIS